MQTISEKRTMNDNSQITSFMKTGFAKSVPMAFLSALIVGIFMSQAVAAAEGSSSPPKDDGEITLMQAVKQTLIKQPSIHLIETQVKTRRGKLQEAAGKFDWVLGSSISIADENTPLGELLRSSTGESVSETGEIIYGLNLDKKLRSGISLSPNIEMTRTADHSFGWQTTNEAGVNFTVTMPLLRGRGKAAAAADEMAAGADLESELLTLRHTISEGVLETVMGYWNYRTAQEKLNILKDSESRAGGLIDVVQQLVDADIRPSADMYQLKANLADKSASRVAAAQVLLEARHSLGLAMGLLSEQIEVLPAPADPFPGDASQNIPVPFTPKGFVELAREHRTDLLASRKKEDSAKILQVWAENNKKPRVDLILTAGYSGLDEGDSFHNATGSFYDNTGGLNTLAALQFQWPFKNNMAAGRLVQQKATYQRAVIASQDLERKISSGVAVAVHDLKRSYQELQSTREAVIFYKKAVETENLKLRSGMSTVIDIITLEDRLTISLLSELRSRQNYANTLINLRFKTGTLISKGKDGSAVDKKTLTSIPSLEKG